MISCFLLLLCPQIKLFVRIQGRDPCFPDFRSSNSYHGFYFKFEKKHSYGALSPSCSQLTGKEPKFLVNYLKEIPESTQNMTKLRVTVVQKMFLIILRQEIVMVITIFIVIRKCYSSRIQSAQFLLTVIGLLLDKTPHWVLLTVSLLPYVPTFHLSLHSSYPRFMAQHCRYKKATSDDLIYIL